MNKTHEQQYKAMLSAMQAQHAQTKRIITEAQEHAAQLTQNANTAQAVYIKARCAASVAEEAVVDAMQARKKNKISARSMQTATTHARITRDAVSITGQHAAHTQAQVAYAIAYAIAINAQHTKIEI